MPSKRPIRRRKTGGGPAVFAPSPLSNQTAYKPGFVGRGVVPARDGHSSATPVTRRLMQPTRTAAQTRVWDCSQCRPYSVLLPVGFAVPSALPQTRCALTAPFHPYPGNTLRAVAVCSLWHCPWGRPRRTLSGTVCPGARTFLPGHLSVIAGAAVQPTDVLGMGCEGGGVKGPACWPSALWAIGGLPAAFAASLAWTYRRFRRLVPGENGAGRR